MKRQVTIGENRTGVATAPDRAAAMQDIQHEFAPTSEASPEERRQETVRNAPDTTLGSLPPPSPGAVVDAGDPSHLRLMDKLGERLAFERTGTRLYEGVLTVLAADGGFEGGPRAEEIEEIRAEELSHFDLLQHVIEELGGDPTAVTPAADAAGVAAMGIGKVVQDPRSNVEQALQAVLVAELADESGWELLIDLARRAGQDRWIPRFETANERERQHVARVKRWLEAANGL